MTPGQITAVTDAKSAIDAALETYNAAGDPRDKERIAWKDCFPLHPSAVAVFNDVARPFIEENITAASAAVAPWCDSASERRDITQKLPVIDSMFFQMHRLGNDLHDPAEAPARLTGMSAFFNRILLAQQS